MKKERLQPLIVCLLFAPSAFGQSSYATQIVSFSPGPGSGIFLPDNALGGPAGGGISAGSLDVCSLGIGGQITLGFEVQIADGPGADFTVFENGFLLSGNLVFAETAFIEVSTDGQIFARFPNRYAGPPGPLSPFGGAPIGSYSGLVGGLPAVSNVWTNQVSPFDPVVSGGESFDLADLTMVFEVRSGAVNIEDIRYVRIVDAVAGSSLDSFGNPVWDNGGAAGNADIDAVAALCHSGNLTPGRPTADLFWDSAGRLNLRLGDPNGIWDLDFAKIRASLNLVELPLNVWLPAFELISFDGSFALLRIPVPLSGTGFQASFAVSVEDWGGEISGDQAIIQG